MRRQMEENPGVSRDADRMERVFAHRRGRGPSAAQPRAALHRLRRVDEHPIVGRPVRQRPRPARLVPRAAVPVHAARRDARDRPGRRHRRPRGARVRQPQGHRRRAQSADDPVRPPLRRARRQPLRPARTWRSSRARGATSSAAPIGSSTSSSSGLRRFVGVGGLGRPVAVGELPLHDAGLPRVLRPPDRQRHARHPALGHGHPAARVELGGAPRRRRRVQADGRADGEARQPDDPPQMLFMLRKRPFTAAETGRDRRQRGRSPAGHRAGKARTCALRRSPGGKEDAGGVRGGVAQAGRPGVRRQPVLFCRRASMGHAPDDRRAAVRVAACAQPPDAGAVCRDRQTNGRAGGAVRGVHRLLHGLWDSASSPWSWRCCRT